MEKMLFVLVLFHQLIVYNILIKSSKSDLHSHGRLRRHTMGAVGPEVYGSVGLAVRTYRVLIYNISFF